MESMNKYVFGNLFAQPSFIEGMARTLDIGNTLNRYNESSSDQQVDIEAMKNDWRAIGDDIRVAISGYERTPFTKVV